jgi:hypothetical protein
MFGRRETETHQLPFGVEVDVECHRAVPKEIDGNRLDTRHDRRTDSPTGYSRLSRAGHACQRARVSLVFRRVEPDPAVFEPRLGGGATGPDRKGGAELAPARRSIRPMEARLRRITQHSWEGELHGYLVHIGERGGPWYVWLLPGGTRTERCLRVGSLAEGAKLAREWTERPGDKRLRTPEQK